MPFCELELAWYLRWYQWWNHLYREKKANLLARLKRWPCLDWSFSFLSSHTVTPRLISPPFSLLLLPLPSQYLPRCAKLSRPGNNPRTNEMMVVIASLDNSVHGFWVSRQFNRMSTNIKPISPNKAPEHPIEAGWKVLASSRHNTVAVKMYTYVWTETQIKRQTQIPKYQQPCTIQHIEEYPILFQVELLASAGSACSLANE